VVPRRIVFLNNQGLGSSGGGVTILRYLAARLAADHAVTVLSHDPPVPGFPQIRQLMLPAPRPPGRAWRIAPLVRARHLARVLPGEEVGAADVVVALDCHFAAALHRLRPRRLAYVSLSCIPRQEWFAASTPGRLAVCVQYAWLERGLLRQAGIVVAASRFHAAELRRYEAMPGLRAVVLAPVFSTASMPPASRHPGEALMILSVGRLEPVKRFDLVPEMAARLIDLPCRFVIAGDGPERARIEARAAALGVADRVILLGAVPDPAPLLAQADLLLHPSRYESFGIAAFEAMRAGVPPICAAGRAATACREYATDGVDSCFLDFDQPKLAARGLRHLVTGKAARVRMAAAARTSAVRLLAAQDYERAFRSRVLDPLLSSQGRAP
jgi:glycosyltransferase involved in cell wall biosynthesis